MEEHTKTPEHCIIPVVPIASRARFRYEGLVNMIFQEEPSVRSMAICLLIW